MKKKIALFAFTNPLTKNKDGGKIDILSRIDSLNFLDCEIDIITNKKKNETLNLLSTKKVNKIYSSVWKNKFYYLFDRLPISVLNRYFKLNERKQYDLAIYENLNMFKFILKKEIKSNLNLLRVHNIESKYRYELFKSKVYSLKSWCQLLEAFKYSLIEKKSLEKFDKFLFISNDEKKIYEKKYPKYKEKFIWMPPVVSEVCKQIKFPKDKTTILSYGDFTVSHNIEGLMWFLKKVYLKTYNKQIKLEIIGNISAKNKKYIEENFKNVYVLGYVDNLDQHIDNASFIIAPILTGAGVKIKILHSLSKGKILITTPKGIEGTTFKHREHLMVAETKEEFIRIYNEILENYDSYKSLPLKAIEEINNMYTIKAQSKIIKDLLNLSEEI